MDTRLEQLQLQIPSNVRLVAASKFQDSSLIRQAYSLGIRHFGENYVQELVQKSTQLLDLNDIKWHFIGHLQSNKVKLLSTIRELWAIETVDSPHLAIKINQYFSNGIKVFIQVNSSGEESKQGINPKDIFSMIDFIHQNCPNLQLVGLMTIGSREHSNLEKDNPEFTLMKQLCDKVKAKHGIELELSMGMSGDWQQAIKQGSTNVRIGTAIFGPRP